MAASADLEAKVPVESTAKHTVDGIPEEGLDRHDGELYSIERVEKVYRKIDRRIIPGECEPAYAEDWHARSNMDQPSGFSIFSLLPSGPI
jgi:hypothetical protein